MANKKNILHKAGDLVAKLAGNDLETLKKATKTKRKAKVINKLSAKDTETLQAYANKSKGDNVTGKEQRLLIDLIKRETGMDFKKTTSCSPCWRRRDKYLKQIAEKNGIHGQIWE